MSVLTKGGERISIRPRLRTPRIASWSSPPPEQAEHASDALRFAPVCLKVAFGLHRSSAQLLETWPAVWRRMLRRKPASDRGEPAGCVGKVEHAATGHAGSGTGHSRAPSFGQLDPMRLRGIAFECFFCLTFAPPVHCGHCSWLGSFVHPTDSKDVCRLECAAAVAGRESVASVCDGGLVCCEGHDLCARRTWVDF